MTMKCYNTHDDQMAKYSGFTSKTRLFIRIFIHSTIRLVFRKTTHWAGFWEEEECKYWLVVLLLFPGTGKALQFRHVPDRHRHVAARTPDLEVEVVAVFGRRVRKVEFYAGEGEFESDSLVLDYTGALDR